MTWLLARSWWFVYTPFAALAMRLLWEETWLTWIRGEQMVGFHLAHAHPVFTLLGFLGFAGTVLWVLLTVGVWAVRRYTLLRAGKVQLCLSIATIVLAVLPVDSWVLRLR